MNPNPEFNLQSEPLIEDPFFNQTFYKQASIGMATFIGGPLGGGFLIRRNFIQFGKPKEGNIALGITFGAMLALIALLIVIPAPIIDKIPGFVIPLVYTTVISAWVSRIHGKALNLHEKAGGAFFSGWKAAGVGVLNMLIFLALFFSTILLTDNFEDEKYNTLIDDFNVQEKLSHDFPANSTNDVTAKFLREKGIPAWEKNLKTMDTLEKMEGLTPEMMDQNQRLRKYSELKLKIFNLVLKSVEENTDKYDAEIDQLTQQLDHVN